MLKLLLRTQNDSKEEVRLPDAPPPARRVSAARAPPAAPGIGRPTLITTPGVLDWDHVDREKRSHVSTLLERDDVKSLFSTFSALELKKSVLQYEETSSVPTKAVKKRILWEDLEGTEHLADGGMCRVYAAIYQGEECVVKTCLPTKQDPEEVLLIEKSLHDEADLLRRVQHPNIIRLLGEGEKEGRYFIVLERLAGVLDKIIEWTSPAGSKRKGPSSTIPKHTQLDSLKWALELAQAMAYLHDDAVPGSMVLHRDLKPENLGVGRDGRLRLLDLGLAHVVCRTFRSRAATYRMSGGVGSLRYMAPEVAQGLAYNEKADVHSFAMILWELLAGTKPYLALDREGFMCLAVRGRRRPPVFKQWPPGVGALLAECWDPAPDGRPPFREVAGHLEMLLADACLLAAAAETGGGGGRPPPLHQKKKASALSPAAAAVRRLRRALSPANLRGVALGGARRGRRSSQEEEEEEEEEGAAAAAPAAAAPLPACSSPGGRPSSAVVAAEGDRRGSGGGGPTADSPLGNVPGGTEVAEAAAPAAPFSPSFHVSSIERKLRLREISATTAT